MTVKKPTLVRRQDLNLRPTGSKSHYYNELDTPETRLKQEDEHAEE